MNGREEESVLKNLLPKDGAADKSGTLRQRMYDYWIGEKKAAFPLSGNPHPCSRLEAYGLLALQIAVTGGFIGGMIIYGPHAFDILEK